MQPKDHLICHYSYLQNAVKSCIISCSMLSSFREKLNVLNSHIAGIRVYLNNKMFSYTPLLVMRFHNWVSSWCSLFNKKKKVCVCVSVLHCLKKFNLWILSLRVWARSFSFLAIQLQLKGQCQFLSICLGYLHDPH